MLKDVQKHKGAYSILALSAVAFLVCVYLYSHMPQLLFWGTVGFGVFYIIWGIMHHLSDHSLTGKIMLEYVLVTALGIGIMSTLLL
jgi:hypothetical protein